MKPTKKQEREIMQVYEAYWAEYINGNVDGMAPLLDASYTQVGSAESEVFSTKKEAVQFLVDTIDQVAGKIEMRNRSTNLEWQNGLVLIHEHCDLYALTDLEWVFYTKFRASTLLQEKKEGWKIIHQHSSFPDAKTEEGQNVAIEKIATENQQLREAVKRRTVELEQKNRELEIETALERVRAKSMAMYKSEELADLSLELVKQVQKLGVATWFCAFNIYNDDPKGSIEWGSNGQGTFPEYRTPREGVFLRYYKAGQKGETLLVNEIGEKECPAHYEYLCTLPGVGEQLLKMKENGIPFPKSQIDHVAYFKYGYVLFITYEPVPESHDIFKRFAKVFEQTYTRFLDLQKAEEQARESKIETALERVRAASMAMHKSEEMQIVVDTIYEQLNALNFEMHAVGMSGAMNPKKGYEVWAGGIGLKAPLQIPYSEATKVQRDYNKVLIERTELFAKTYKGKIKKEYIDFLLHNNKFPSFLEKLMVESQAFSTTLATSKNSGMQILRYTEKPYTDSENAILLRFAKVFEQAYIRFMDLQKAEAQTREAQIEAALERVRSASMAMHNSIDVGDTVITLFDEVLKLGLDKSIRIGIGILEGHEGMETWSVTSTPNGKVELKMGMLDMTIHPMLTGLKKAWKRGKTSYSYDYVGGDVLRYYKALNNEPKYPFEADLDSLPEKEYHKSFFFNEGILFSFAPNSISEESAIVLNRFAGVFGQTYRRYLDLRKAEAQVREAQIEAALERVRSRSMAMHESKEMLEVIGVVSEQLQQLNLNFDTVSFAKNKQEGGFTFWMTSRGQPKPILMQVPTMDSPVLNRVYLAKKTKIAFLTDVFSSEENREWHEHLIKYSDLKHFPDKIKDFILNAPGFARSSFLLKNIDLYVGNYRAIPFTDEENSIFKRFAHVFEQSYTRFLDLQKAEAQAKEAQIENALEKVRSRTMAMQKSHELPEAANNLFLQVQELGIPAWSAGYCIWETEDKKAASCNMSSEGEIQKSFILPTIGEGYNFYDPLKNGETFYIEELGGDALVKHYEFMKTLPKVGEILQELINAGLSLPTFQIFHILYFPHGYLMFITYEQVPEAHDIFKRFAKVFEQTYTRFLDLQKAEAQAREATKQASLDRVRGQIASMRSTDDLNRITPLVWNELITIGVPFSRCGVFIIDEPTKIVEVYLSAPDGHSLGVLNLQFNADPLTKNTVAHWRKRKIFKAHWNREDFISWTQSLMDQGQISDKNTYQGAANPPESLDLHFIPFTQGMLYVGSEHSLNDEHITLVQSLADAFAIAYARYEDFTKLEKAKKSVEATLSELKATQNQLVQSEKMASLGELTAGIAHEIQNPLNFVNNFSEVSSELIEEMNEEIENGDMEEAKAIANDIKQNLEKINHHGKRADAIVKGMLQHSRSSTGIKEPTDINALADEYLRLAYHGLRAKDKSFNATMKTDYDGSLEKVNVIPQDIGRVILNLITNAFYVVDEKKKQLKDGYQPTVSVSTKKRGDKIEISVKDNGNGIPDKVKEKIFQPFFTTKPTGKGTGLGLSMSYDIVNKGHGGELRVVTTVGEGTIFTIELPVT